MRHGVKRVIGGFQEQVKFVMRFKEGGRLEGIKEVVHGEMGF